MQIARMLPSTRSAMCSKLRNASNQCQALSARHKPWRARCWIRAQKEVTATTTAPSVAAAPTQSSSSSHDSVDSVMLEAMPSARLVPSALTLFDEQHLEQWTPLLILYFPFGCALAAFRMALWIAGIALDAPWFRNPTVISTYLWLLGCEVVWKNPENLPSESHVMVTNHQTVGDLMVLFPLQQRYQHLITTAIPRSATATQNLPVVLLPASADMYDALAEAATAGAAASVNAARTRHSATDKAINSMTAASSCSRNVDDSVPGSSGHADYTSSSGTDSDDGERSFTSGSSSSSSSGLSMSRRRVAAGGGRRDTSTGSTAALAAPPVHLFPEGGMTNGRAGMLQFSRGFMRFVAGRPVAPVALRVSNPLGIRTHTLLSSFAANLFWLSFVPWVRMEATALPPMQPAPGEGRGAFVKRVQQVIADELGTPVFDVNIQQKRKLMAQAAAQQARR